MPDFASFKSTYKPLPLETINETGRVMQERYFKNRDAADKLQSSLNNLNVDALDKSIVTRVIADTNNELNTLNGEYEKADNTIRNIVKRIDQDEELKGAVQDKANFDATLKMLQEKAMDAKSGVTKEAIESFVIHSRNNKRNTIAKNSETGLLENRLTASAPPLKPDVEDQLIKIWTSLKTNPDQITEFRKEIDGYITKVDKSGVSEQELMDATRRYLMSKPEYTQYNNYINSAKIIQQYGDNPIPLSDFVATLGLDVTDENGGIKAHTFIKDENGKIAIDPKTKLPVEIKTNINEIFNDLVKDDDGTTSIDNYTTKSRNAYLQILNEKLVGNYAALASAFASTSIDKDLIADVNDAARRKRLEQQNRITSMTVKDSQVIVKDFSFDYQNAAILTSKSEMDKAQKAIKVITLPDGTKINDANDQRQYDLAKQKYDRDVFINHQFSIAALESPVIKVKLQDSYKKMIDGIKATLPFGTDVVKENYAPDFETFKSWLAGDIALPKYKETVEGKEWQSQATPSKGNLMANQFQGALRTNNQNFADRFYGDNNFIGASTIIKKQFLEDAQKYIQENGVKGGFAKAASFQEQTKEGNYINSTVNELVGTNIWENSTAYDVIPSGHEEPIKLNDYLTKHGVNLAKWVLSSSMLESNNHVIGGYDLTFTNKDTGETKNVMVTQNPENALENTLSDAKKILAKSLSKEVDDFAINQVAFASYGMQFNTLLDAETTSLNTNGSRIPSGTIVYGIPIRTTVGEIKQGNAKVIFDTETQMYILQPLSNGKFQGRYAEGYTMQELINSAANTTYFSK